MSWEYKRRFFQMHGSKKGRNISATASFNLFITREFDTFPNEKQRISRMNAYIFLSNLLFLYIGFFRLFML